MSENCSRGKKMFQVLQLFVICLGVFLVISIFIPFTYGINDDITMRDIASGAMSGRPDGHLIFVKYVLGAFLAMCYRIFPGVDWYGCIWLGLFCLCISLLLYRWKNYYSRKNKKFFTFVFSFFLFFLILGLEHIVHFQFTVVAAIVAGTAIFLYNTMDFEEQKKRKFIDYLPVLLLMWLAYCIRSRVFWMAVPFAGLIFLFKKDVWKNRIGILVISLAGITVISGIERWAYSGQEWRDYLEYNQYRANVYDHYGFPSYEQNMDFYRSINMEEYDVANLSRYSLFLIDDIERGKMQKISDYAKQQREDRWTRIKSGIKCSFKGFFELENLPLNLLAHGVLLFNLFYEFRRKKRTFFLCGGFLVVEGLMWMYLGYLGRLPARVGGALLFLVFLSAWSVYFQEHREKVSWQWAKSWMKALLIAALTGIALFSLAGVWKRQKNYYTDNLEREKLEKYFESHEENVYFVPTYILSNYLENFKVFKTFRISNGFSLGGWSAYMPLKMAGLKEYGIIDVDRAIIEKDGVYLILPGISTKIEEHYRGKYGIVSWEECDRIYLSDEEMSVFQIRMQE